MGPSPEKRVLKKWMRTHKGLVQDAPAVTPCDAQGRALGDIATLRTISAARLDRQFSESMGAEDSARTSSSQPLPPVFDIVRVVSAAARFKAAASDGAADAGPPAEIGRLLKVFEDLPGDAAADHRTGRRWARTDAGFLSADSGEVRPCNKAGRLLSSAEKLEKVQASQQLRLELEEGELEEGRRGSWRTRRRAMWGKRGAARRRFASRRAARAGGLPGSRSSSGLPGCSMWRTRTVTTRSRRATRERCLRARAQARRRPQQRCKT